MGNTLMQGLVSKGVLSQEDARAVFDAAESKGMPIEQALREVGVSQESILAAKAEETGVPTRVLDGEPIPFNVLEHIYNYENVLKESIRTLKKEGAMVLAVPFLIQLHPSPKDHWRFSEETLSRMFFDTGFEDVSVRTLGTGLFGALAQLSYGILHYSMFRWSVKKIAVFLDTIIKVTIKNNVYGPAQYPLGYIVIARKK